MDLADGRAIYTKVAKSNLLEWQVLFVGLLLLSGYQV